MSHREMRRCNLSQAVHCDASEDLPTERAAHESGQLHESMRARGRGTSVAHATRSMAGYGIAGLVGAMAIGNAFAACGWFEVPRPSPGGTELETQGPVATPAPATPTGPSRPDASAPQPPPAAGNDRTGAA